ncbi:MAG: hypothetical protein H7233_04885 [Pseudorhodobacter sp.]|nr:hypothetical protein [Frankiaceae bacterium]
MTAASVSGEQEPVRVGDELADVVARLSDPPSAPLAERAVLGSVMLWPAVADRLLPFTYEHYFSHPFHRQVLASVKRLHARRAPTDPTAVLTDLHAHGFRHVGAADAGVVLHDLLVAAWTPESGAHHLTVLCEYAARRRVVEAGVRLIQQGQRRDTDVPTLMRAVGAEYGKIRAEVNRHDRASHLGDRPGMTARESEDPHGERAQPAPPPQPRVVSPPAAGSQPDERGERNERDLGPEIAS